MRPPWGAKADRWVMSERTQQDRTRRRIAVAGYSTAAAASVLTAGLVAGVTQTAQAQQQSTTTATTTTPSATATTATPTKAAATKTASATPTASASTSAVVTAPQTTTVQGGSNGS